MPTRRARRTGWRRDDTVTVLQPNGGRIAAMERTGMAMTQFSRRLSDKILAAFDQACEQGQIGVAEHLVRALELALTREGGPNRVDKREYMEPVLAAYERLRTLQSPSH
jgi:hypothetical protein